MMDRSELIRYANDTLLDEFQQRLTIQIRYIDNQMAMLKKELSNLQSERNHLDKFFPEQEPPKQMPKATTIPLQHSRDAEIPPPPDFLKQPEVAE